MIAAEPRPSLPLDEFVQHASAHAARIEASKTPEVLTVDGRAALVMVDVESYETLLGRLERAELLESLRQAIRDSDAGLGIPIEEAFARLDARYGV